MKRFGEELQGVNDMGLWDFQAALLDNGTLRILGSNDFAYYHVLEIEFHDVRFTDVPADFSHAQFRVGDDDGEEVTVWITGESMTEPSRTEFEVRAAALTVRIERVPNI